MNETKCTNGQTSDILYTFWSRNAAPGVPREKILRIEVEVLSLASLEEDNVTIQPNTTYVTFTTYPENYGNILFQIHVPIPGTWTREELKAYILESVCPDLQG